MTELKLTKNETMVLDETLAHSLSQLQDEIAHTDLAEYRAMLKKRREVLLKIHGLLH